jgi:hypothetical protein
MGGKLGKVWLWGGVSFLYAAARRKTLSWQALRVFHPLICFVCLVLPMLMMSGVELQAHSGREGEF